MSKYWGKQNFSHESFPKVGQKQKTERKREKERRAKVGNNNGQLHFATPPLVAHAKPPGPMNFVFPSIWFKIWVAIAQKKKENIMC